MKLTVTDVPEKGRFEAHDEDGTPAGVLTYQVTGNVVAYTHTDAASPAAVDALAAAAMDDARSRGRVVVPICPVLGAWLDKHTSYDKIVARSHRRVK